MPVCQLPKFSMFCVPRVSVDDRASGLRGPALRPTFWIMSLFQIEPSPM